jgi:hypothetical protein
MSRPVRVIADLSRSLLCAAVRQAATLCRGVTRHRRRAAPLLPDPRRRERRVNVRRTRRYLAYLVALSATGLVPVAAAASTSQALTPRTAQVQSVSTAAHGVLALSLSADSVASCNDDEWADSWGDSWRDSWRDSWSDCGAVENAAVDRPAAEAETLAAILHES